MGKSTRLTESWLVFLFLVTVAYLLVIVCIIYQDQHTHPQPWQDCKRVEISEGPQQQIQSRGWLCPDGLTYWGPYDEEE